MSLKLTVTVDSEGSAADIGEFTLSHLTRLVDRNLKGIRHNEIFWEPYPIKHDLSRSLGNCRESRVESNMSRVETEKSRVESNMSRVETDMSRVIF